MNYTKTLRDYCLQNKGKIFDTGKMAEEYFPMIIYKTLLRIMSRLEQEGIVSTIAKGVYYINDDAQDIDAAIINCYVGNSHGMKYGDALYYDLGIISNKPERISIYTNMISSSHKTIGKYDLTLADIYYGKEECNLINLLEVIENCPALNEIDVEGFAHLVESGARSYMDWKFKTIVENIDYKYATVVTFAEAMNNYGAKDCGCLEIYKMVQRN